MHWLVYFYLVGVVVTAAFLLWIDGGPPESRRDWAFYIVPSLFSWVGLVFAIAFILYVVSSIAKAIAEPLAVGIVGGFLGLPSRK